MRFNKAIGDFCCVSLFILTSLLAGCATYSPAERGELTPADILKGKEAVVSSESCEFRVVILKDRDLAKRYVGIDPAESSMIPVFMRIANSGNRLIKLDASGSSLLTAAGEPFQSLTIDEAIEKAMRSDAEVVGWGIAFGTVGAIVSASNTASTNKSLEEDYHKKSFKPNLINTESSGEGLVFFHVPPEKQEFINAAVIQLLDPTSNETKKVTVRF